MVYKRIARQEELRLRKAIGSNIRRARLEMNMSLDVVSRELKIAKPKLSEMESGVREPSAIVLGMMAELFDVPVSFFYTGKDAHPVGDALFDLRRVLQPLRDELNEHLAKTALEMWAKTYPNQAENEAFFKDAEAFAKQGSRMIEKNRDGAWQDMKGGANFEIQLNMFCKSLSKLRGAACMQRQLLKHGGVLVQKETHDVSDGSQGVLEL